MSTLRAPRRDQARTGSSPPSNPTGTGHPLSGQSRWL